MPTHPSAATVVIEQRGSVYFEAKFRHNGRQVKRRIGPAWLELAEDGWTPRRGRVPEGFYDKARANVRAAGIVAEYVTEEANRATVERERKEAGATFREIAHAYLDWLEHVKGAKPATLSDHRVVLAEPGAAYKRGSGTIRGPVMNALGNRPASKVTTREIETLLAKVAQKASPRTVNKYRAVICAVFNYGTRDATFKLPSNPASAADKRRENDRAALVYYSHEEVEAIARALADGSHRDPARPAVTDGEREARRIEDHQDAELIRVAAYAGLRMGELLALRWRDVDFTGHALTISRAMSAGVESSTKSGRVRRVPLPDQAAGALDRLSRRADFTGAGELVFCNALGRPLDGSALRRRFKKARDAAKLRPLRFHDLRHTYGSLLAANGVDLVTIQSVMGHSALATTGRYLHAKPATELATEFTRAFESSTPVEPALEPAHQ
jgi:integrase